MYSPSSAPKECNKVHLTVEKKLDHTHGVVGPLMVSRNDALSAPGGRNFELTNSLGHVHAVYLSAAQLQEIVKGKVITVDSTVSSIPGMDTITTAHSHAVQVQCNDPYSFWERHRTTLIILLIVVAVAIFFMIKNRKEIKQKGEDFANSTRAFFKGRQSTLKTPARTLSARPLTRADFSESDF